MCLWFCESHDVCVSFLLVTKLSHSVLLSQVSQSFVLSSLASLEIAKSRFAHCHFSLSPHIKISNIEILTWTINILVHILVLCYLIYLNKGSCLVSRVFMLYQIRLCFIFTLTKQTIYLQFISSLDLSCLA